MTPTEQRLLARSIRQSLRMLRCLPMSELVMLSSASGKDGHWSLVLHRLLRYVIREKEFEVCARDD